MKSGILLGISPRLNDYAVDDRTLEARRFNLQLDGTIGQGLKFIPACAIGSGFTHACAVYNGPHGGLRDHSAARVVNGSA